MSDNNQKPSESVIPLLRKLRDHFTQNQKWIEYVNITQFIEKLEKSNDWSEDQKQKFESYKMQYEEYQSKET